MYFKLNADDDNVMKVFTDSGSEYEIRLKEENVSQNW